MKRLFLALMFVGAAAVLGGACGSEETGDGTLCDPGEEIFCRCRGGGDATKTCLEDGQSFGECSTIDGPCPEVPETTTGPDDDDDGSDGETPICFPYDEVPCTCDDGSNGLQICDASGDFYGDCSVAGSPCGSGSTTTSTTATTSTGGGTGTELLFTPCSDNGECKTGSCLMGMCTKECGNWEECTDDGDIQGECARFAGGAIQLCAPYCSVQQDCVDPYGDESRCGYGVAPDDPQFAFLVCGDWGSDLQVPPLGTECAEDVECHLNLAGAERICIFESCEEGCYVADDCPEDRPECSSDGSVPGTCG